MGDERVDLTLEDEIVDLSALFRKHRLSLVRLAIVLVDDLSSAEDIVQDAFASMHHHLDDLREPAAALAYLQRSVANGARSLLRRRRTARFHLSKLVGFQQTPLPDERLLLADEHVEILAALKRLPIRSQQVLVLRYWSELSESEIATVLDIAPGTVRSTASRALNKLQRLLEASA